MLTTLRIATRKSTLALKQTAVVEKRLQSILPAVQVTLVPILTEGDKATDIPLTQLGGKGLFVKALERALLEGRADIAVHSIKDMTVDIPDGLLLAAVCEREDPRDVLVSNAYSSLASLPLRAKVGTTSLRRQYQLRAFRPDLQIEPLRGNVDTRLTKLDAGEFEGVILAAAGLIRLGKTERIRCYLDSPAFLPASGQGAIGIECRTDDRQVLKLVSQLDHPPSHCRVLAERAVNRALGASCLVPVAAHAHWVDSRRGAHRTDNSAKVEKTEKAEAKGSSVKGSKGGERLSVCGQVGRLDGSQILSSTVEGNASDAETLGKAVAESLLAQGAQEIIKQYL